MKTMNKTSRVFSVIALVLCLMMVLGITAFAAETENAAEGEVVEIRTWDDLKALDARVEGGDLMEGVTVKLMNDIDLYEMGEDGEPVTFNPIGANTAYFKGTFDGQGYTIKNMYQSGWALGYDWDNYGTIGLFAYLWNATIKDVTIENAECFVEGGNVAAIAGCAWGDCTFENITVKNSTFATYNNRAGGIVGYTGGSGTFTFKDITVDEDTVIAGLWGSFDSSLGGVMGQLQSASQAVFENVRVECRLDAYNDVTAAYKYYAYRMCGMLIGRIPVDANNQPIMDNVTIGEDVVIDYSGMPDYTYTNATGSWQRVEAGYAYGGVDMTQYPDAEVLYKPLNSMFGGQQYGSYGQDDHEDIVAEGRVASFDGEYFTSLKNAIKAADGAMDGEGNAIPVKLMADYNEDIVITESLSLDLNGYAFTGNVTTVDGKKVVFEDGKYTAVETPKINVATKAELNTALAAANDGDVIVLTADIDYGTDQLKIEKAITLDLGGYTLTTRNAWGGMSVKNNATVKNGTIVHASNTAAIKVWNATAFENLVIDVQGKGDANKTIGGIVLQSGSTTRVGSIKDVTIKGAALTNGIETYNCGDATENVIGSMENVTIDAVGTGMLISAPCGTATNCTISGDVNGIEIWIKGNYSATLSLVDSKVEGGVYAHDEFNNNAGVVNNGTLSFTVDEATEVDDVTLTLARAENVEGELKEIKENAQAKVNNTYYATIADAIKAAKAGDVVTVFAGTYAMPSMKAGITIVGEGEVVFEGTLSGTLENLTLKNIYIKGANAQRWAYAKGDLVFENVTFHATSVYALHFDGITAGATLTYKDCTIIGWAAMSGSPASCVFDGCTFKGNGTYGLIRTYFDATIENCTFDVANVNTTDGYQDGIHAVDGAVVTVNNCTNVNGDMMDVINTASTSFVKLDGELVHKLAGKGTETSPYLIYNLAELILFRDSVNAGETTYNAPGVYVALAADIDLAGENWVAIGSAYIDHGFMGNFDGNGFKIKNLTIINPAIDSDGYAYAGFFGVTEGTDKDNQNFIKNLVIENVTIKTNGHIVAAAIAYPYYTVVENITVCGDIAIEGGDYTAGVLAYTRRCTTASNLIVAGNAGSYITGAQTVGGVISDIQMNGGLTANYSNFSASGLTITGEKSVGGISGIIAKQNINGATVENVTLVCSDARVGIVAGSLGGTSTISNVTTSNVTGATAVVGATYDSGYLVVKNGDVYTAVAPVAEVNGVKYATLAEAIKNASAGSTITLLADVNESVTINKNLTIDGAEKNYTGTMTINNVTVTIDNVNFVKGQVYKNKNTGTTANITIKNCDFDGQGMNAYAINLGGTKSIVIENVTAKDYGYGLLQVPSSCAGLTVKNVTVSGCYYGMKVDYANAVTIENANIDATVGVYDSNFGTKTYTIKDSKISSISIWQRNTTNYTTFKFEGVNEVATLSTSAYAKYTGVQIGTKIYDSLANAWVAAQDGDTIKLLGDIAIDTAITNTKKITLDLNGKTITGTDNATASFGLITNKGELTITGNGKMTLVATNNRGWNAYSSVISNTVGGKLVVENGTIEHLGGTDMAYAIDNLTNGKGTYAETVINGGTIKSTYRAIRMFLNGVEAQNILTVNGGTIEGANKSIWVQDPSANNNTGKITVVAGAVLNGDVYLYATAGSAEWPVEVSIAASAVNGEVITGNMPNGYILEKKSGNWTVNEYIAKVGNKYYKSLQAAVDAANQYQSVTLLQDAEGAGVVINKKTTIDFNGFTYAVNTPVGSTGTESNGFQILAGNYTVRLLNGTLKVADSAADKFYILVQNYADLIVQKMTLDGTNLDKYAFTDGDSYTLSNNSGNVQINTSKIIANNDGDKAFAFDACDQTKNGYELPKVVVYTSSTIEGKIEAAAKVGTAYYATLEQAIDATAEGKTITLLTPVVVNAGETLNLNKAVTISYTSKVAGEDMITVRGTLIVDGATLVYNNKDVTGSNVTVSTISAEPGSVVEIKSGVVKNNSANNGAKGIYAYAIDMLTNGNMGDVTVTISGGEVISTNYMAIRQFNNGTACKNTLTVTGGYIYGAKRAIQIHMDNDAAYLTISGGTIEAGDYALCLFPKNATNVAVIGGKFIGTIYSGTNGFITGGTFDEAVYEGYITESYKQVKVDGVYNVIFDETYGSVATIGDKKFNSFASAWEAAQNGDTIVLQNNITIDTETFTIADGKKITLDMNGYTITVTDNSTKNYELFYIYGEMVVTGKGVIELTATNNRAWNASSGIFHNRGGVLTIENGTFTHNGGSDMAFVVDNSGNWFGDATTNINGGTLTSSYIAIRNRMEQNTHGASGKAILNVYGGKIDGTSRAIWAQAASTSTVVPATGEINIFGGEIGLIDTARSEGAISMTTITGGTVAAFKGESGELKVNGGTITGDITILFADGTEPVKTVIKSKVYYGAVAKMGNSYFATLADAIKKCTGAQAITLLRDIEGEGFVITGKTAIDFNGYTYTVTAPVAGTNVGVQINASGKTVRLINGTLTAAEGSGVEVLVENNSTLTIQRQTLAVTSGTALLVKGGSASINIATINAEGAVAFEVVSGKITVYSEGKSSFINGEKLAKKSGTSYVAK